MCKHYSPPLYQLSYGEISMGSALPVGTQPHRMRPASQNKCVIRESNPGPNVGNVRS